jgi:hypothetical protein
MLGEAQQPSPPFSLLATWRATHMSKTPPQPPRPSKADSPGQWSAERSPEVERALALRDVMEHVVEVQREITAPKRLRRSRARLILASVICVPLLAASAYSWIARPGVIWGSSARSVSPQRREANVRFAMFLLARRIQSYRNIEGALPSSLAAVGSHTPGLSYAVVSDSVFELRAIERDTAIVFRSDARVSDFLGSAPKIIAGQAK